MSKSSIRFCQLPISRITGNLGTKTHFTGYRVNQDLFEIRTPKRNGRVSIGLLIEVSVYLLLNIPKPIFCTTPETRQNVIEAQGDCEKDDLGCGLAGDLLPEI